MQVLLDEAKESYDEDIVVELQSNTSEEMDENVDRIEAWLEQWKKDNAAGRQRRRTRMLEEDGRQLGGPDSLLRVRHSGHEVFLDLLQKQRF